MNLHINCKCGGVITQWHDGVWECSDCDHIQYSERECDEVFGYFSNSAHEKAADINKQKRECNATVQV